MSKKLFIFLILLLLLQLRFLSFTPWPEMLSRPYLLLHGWLPYSDIIMEHAPLSLYVLAAWFKVVGLGIIQLKLFTWLVLAVTGILVYTFTSKNFSPAAARTAFIAYLFLSLAYEGNGLWFDLALSPVIFLTFWLVAANKSLAAGLSFGLALLTKQTALWLLIPIFGVLPRRAVDIVKFCFGLFAIISIFLLLLFSQGIFDDFTRWAIRPIANSQFPTIQQLVYLAPFIVLFLQSAIHHKILTKIKLLALFGVAGIFPRWGLFHVQPALPFLALLIGVFFSSPKYQLSKLLYLTVLLLFLSRQISQIWLFPDRFSEADFSNANEFVVSNSSPTDKILVLNTWESLYALSDRLPASRPLYPFLPWYLNRPGVQGNIVAVLKSDPPQLVISGAIQESGLGAYQPAELNEYILREYREKAKIGPIKVYEKN